jgi:hypothetical protein
MTDRTVRFIRNLRFVLDGLSVEELYQVSLALRDQIARRGIDAGPEAKALTAALLLPARAEHRAVTADVDEYTQAGILAALRELAPIGSSDCAEEVRRNDAVVNGFLDRYVGSSPAPEQS